MSDYGCVGEKSEMIRLINQRHTNERKAVIAPEDKKYFALAKQFRVIEGNSGSDTMFEIRAPRRMVVHQAMVYSIIRDAHFTAFQKVLTSERAIYNCFKDKYSNIPRIMIQPYLRLREKSAKVLKSMTSTLVQTSTAPPPSQSSLVPTKAEIESPQKSVTDAVSCRSIVDVPQVNDAPLMQEQSVRIMQHHSVLGGRVKVSHLFSLLFTWSYSNSNDLAC